MRRFLGVGQWSGRTGFGVPGTVTLPVRAVSVAAALPLVATLTGVPEAAAAPRTVRLATDAGTVVRSAEVRVAAGRTALRTSSYSMVAATWRAGSPRVAVRTGPGERWRSLRPLEDGPTAGSDEGGPRRHGSEPLWVGPDRDLEVRVRGRHRGVELVLVDPGTLESDRTTSPTATRTALRTASAERAPAPRLFSRADWGADPRYLNGEPRYTDRLKQVHVHHTAGSNDYTRADVPRMIRSMYRYHTQTLGWFDLGYNFLVDRFGRSWVGRSGGPYRLVRGAHTLGFNHASTGVALIGSFEGLTPSRQARTALVRLGAWKLDRHGRDAEGTVAITSQGSDRFPAGRRVRLPAVDGHRDTNHTACPGARLYDRLPGLRSRMQGRIDSFS